MSVPAAGVRSFRAMGCDVRVAGAGPAAFVAVRALFERREATFSRFRPASELNRVNASPGDAVVVSPLFAGALRQALRAAEATGGLVDPTLGAALLSAGYVDDLARLRPDPRPPGPPAPGCHELVRLVGCVLGRPPGLLLDLNGVVKALAADDALALIGGDGLVAAGGDVAVRGSARIDLPQGAAVELHGGGIATSGTARRRWQRGGAEQHHLIDPRTGRPSTSRWTQVTVAAGSCLGADVAAKAAFLLDGDGPDWLDERRLPGRFVGGSEVVVNEAWRFAVEPAPPREAVA